MKGLVCRRTWEAEAIEDGRLDPTARASFERHATACEACGKELRMLARIGQTMQSLPEYPSQAIDRRRLRIMLLQRANDRLMRGRSHSLGILGVAAACTIAATVGGVRWNASRHTESLAAHVPAFEVVEVGHASWTTTTIGGAVHVSLSEGTTSVHVEHLGHDQEFLVELPDGDLEVRGTRFQVSVVDKRTTLLDVSEGVVALRLAGQPQVVLTAGEKWSASAKTAAASTNAASVMQVPPSLPSEPVAAMLPPPTRQNEITLLAPPRPRQNDLSLVTPPSARIANALESRSEAKSEEEPRPVADIESLHAGDDSVLVPAGTGAAHDGYAGCISAFTTGDYAEANRLLSIFVRDNPSDARAEDAAFLLAVSHARMGDLSGAAKLAKDYLQRYPTGLRHKEAEHLVRSAETPRR